MSSPRAATTASHQTRRRGGPGGTALSIGLALCLTTSLTGLAQAAPDPSSPDPRVHRVTVLCDQLGEVDLELTDGLDQPGAVRVAGTGPVHLAGEPSVTVRPHSGDARRTAALNRRPTSAEATGLQCEPVTLELQAGAVASPERVQAAGLSADESVTTTIQARMDYDTDSVVRAAAEQAIKPMAVAPGNQAAYGAVEAFPYSSQLTSYLAGRSGSVALAYRAEGTSTIYSHVKGSATNVTASIVKIAVMATVMDKAQREGRALSAWEKSQISPMIRYSDNTATTALWNHVGRGSAVGATLSRMGLRQTTPGYAGYWGLTVTSAPDQVVLMDHFARSNPVINATNRSYGLSLMRSVASDQDWGVTAGSGDDIAVKNGWLPRSDGWHVNSVGYNHKLPRRYSAAALTHSTTAGMSTQISTIEGASRIMWNRQVGARGDFTNDGRADLFGVKGDTLHLFAGLGNGRLGAPVARGAGWSAVTWIGSPGDVTRDGRSDLLARRSDGTLHLYRGTGDGTVTWLRQVGHGWDGITAFATVGDFDGDRTPDLLGRARDGRLIRYVLPSTGGAYNAGTVGTSWNSMTAILGVQGVTNDVRGDVIAMRNDGLMFAYTSTGVRLAPGKQVGHGWRPVLVASSGDLTGDQVDDISYQTSTGLQTYPVARGGQIQPARPSGTTATGFRLLG
ncbi:FG-GAP-like repeat-containing protein [Luteococcus sp. Sow4_B9]|uniref:FG-GAP-like repeat-containing protein n=1 Tax=Luteococcus sp. Sow4_B9 TaxID=3438792 RepID=UPI003F95CD26